MSFTKTFTSHADGLQASNLIVHEVGEDDKVYNPFNNEDTEITLGGGSGGYEYSRIYPSLDAEVYNSWPGAQGGSNIITGTPRIVITKNNMIYDCDLPQLAEWSSSCLQCGLFVMTSSELAIDNMNVVLNINVSVPPNTTGRGVWVRVGHHYDYNGVQNHHIAFPYNPEITVDNGTVVLHDTLSIRQNSTQLYVNQRFQIKILGNTWTLKQF